MKYGIWILVISLVNIPGMVGWNCFAWFSFGLELGLGVAIIATERVILMSPWPWEMKRDRESADD